MDKDFYKKYFEVEKNHWWFRVRRNIVSSLIKSFDLPKDAKIFDLGCGSGYLVGQLQKLGYNVLGEDVSAEAIRVGTEKGIKNLSTAQDAIISRPERDLDLILALDVIEHIENDSGAIRGLEKALKPGGMAIVTVPAYQWLWGVQDDVAHHFRRYNIKQLTSLIRNNSNLKIIKKSYFNTFLFVPIAGLRLLSRWLGIENRESDFDINSGLINRMLYGIFNVESKLLNYTNFPFGVSILMILKNEQNQ